MKTINHFQNLNTKEVLKIEQNKQEYEQFMYLKGHLYKQIRGVEK